MSQFDLIQHLYRQRAFSRATFGPGDRTEGVTDHIRKELGEIVKAGEAHRNAGADRELIPIATPTGNDLIFEWIDVILLGLDGAWRAGFTPEEIAYVLERKQTSNETRNWPDWRTADPNKAIEHVR